MKIFVVSFFILCFFIESTVTLAPPKDEICKLPPMTDDRTCTGHEEMWSYSMKTGRCERVIYDGCDGTANLFETEEECIEKCVDS